MGFEELEMYKELERSYEYKGGAKHNNSRGVLKNSVTTSA